MVDKGRTDWTYLVRASPDPVSWTTIAGMMAGEPFVPQGAHSVFETGEDIPRPVNVEDTHEILTHPRRILDLEIFS